MSYPFWDLPFGYGILMAAVAIIHVSISHFAIGGGLFLVVSAMNFLLGGILIVCAGRLGWQNETVRRFLRLFPSVMAATVTLGVAPLLFLQLVYPVQMYSAAIVSAWFWLMIIPAVILAYYCLYAASFAADRSAAKFAALLWPAVLALLYVSLTYSSVFSMAEHPDLIRTLYALNQTGLRWNPEAGDYVLRWLHMVLGAVTVGSFFVGVLGKDDPRVFSFARKILMFGMAAAGTAGVGYLLSLRTVLPGVMRTFTIWALAGGVLAALGALYLFHRRRFLATGLTIFVSVFLMVVVRHEVRLLGLRPGFSPGSWRIAPQWSTFVIFAAALLLAIGMIIYMLRLFFRTRSSS